MPRVVKQCLRFTSQSANQKPSQTLFTIEIILNNDVIKTIILLEIFRCRKFVVLFTIGTQNTFYSLFDALLVSFLLV